jgi:hypothetical protein
LCLSKRVQTKKVVHKQPNQECALAARLAAKIKQALEVKISAKIPETQVCSLVCASLLVWSNLSLRSSSFLCVRIVSSGHAGTG